MNNMKMKLVLFASVSIALASCQTAPKEDYSWIKKGLDVASAQLQLSAEEVSGTGMLPRSIRTGYDMDFLCRQLERDSLTFKDSLRAQPTADQLGKRRLCNVYDWTSGFFPGLIVVRIRTDRKRYSESTSHSIYKSFESCTLLQRHTRFRLYDQLQLWQC